MSFKREGDDFDLLQNLKHRRVSELLANYIPEDEAKLLSNGRLTCLVCSQRPIFDTLSVLSLHRKGKKHISELSKYLGRKQELEMKRVKAQQISYLQTGVVPPRPGAIARPHKLLASDVAYRSCCRRRHSAKCEPQRKPVLDVSCLQEKSDTCSNEVATIVQPSANSQVRHYLKDLWRKKPLEKVVKKCREHLGGSMACDSEKVPANGSEKTLQAKITAVNVNDPDAEKAAAYSLQLKMSGWLKDSDGLWIKDPEAEFDSDEDEPPPPPS